MTDPSHDIDHLRSEGDINISPLRQKWSLHHIDEETQKVLQEDNEVFLHQSLSTPCLNVLEKCEGATSLIPEADACWIFMGITFINWDFHTPR